MNHMSNAILKASVAGLLIGLLAACNTIPEDALKLSPESLERRQLQTRRFEGTSETTILAASAGVLQDLGFNLDESEAKLGVLVASKDRSAVSTGQVTAAVFVALFTGTVMHVDKNQKIRVSLVARPASQDVSAGEAANFFVRVTFQRLVWNTNGQLSQIASIDDAEVYQQFFEALSKSLFLEANQI
jgi:hypothetical protein